MTTRFEDINDGHREDASRYTQAGVGEGMAERRPAATEPQSGRSAVGRQRVVLIANTTWYLYNFRRGTLLALRDAGWEVVCLAPRDEYSPKLENEFGVDYREVDVAGPNRGPLREAAGLFQVARTLKKIQPAFVFNFTIKANVYGGLACRLLRLPYANNVSGLGTIFVHSNAFYRALRRLYIAANRRANHVFFQNPEDRDLFAQKGQPPRAPVTVLPGSGVDTEAFTPAPMPQGPLRFLLIARILGDKGIREYVEAARRIRREHPDCRFLLAGPLDAANTTAIPQAEVEAWEREGVIEYLGVVEDVRSVLAEAHIFVLPSYREGMPRTVMEAAATGRPALVSDVPGCRQAVNPEKTGWYCEAADADSLTEWMRHIYDLPRNEIEAMGHQARTHAENHFTESTVIQAYLDCLHHHANTA